MENLLQSTPIELLSKWNTFLDEESLEEAKL